ENANVAGVDPVRRYRRDRPAIFGTDLESVLDVLAQRRATAGCSQQPGKYGRFTEPAAHRSNVPLTSSPFRAAQDSVKSTATPDARTWSPRSSLSTRP